MKASLESGAGAGDHMVSDLLFGQIPNRMTVLGGVIVIASGLYVLHRERVARACKPVV